MSRSGARYVSLTERGLPWIQLVRRSRYVGSGLGHRLNIPNYRPVLATTLVLPPLASVRRTLA